MLELAIIIAVAFILQFVLTSFQMKDFNNSFVRLRRKGKVAIGRKPGAFHAGAIVMFLIDDNGIILEGKKIEGTTFLARVKDFPGLEGRFVGGLTEEDGPKNHRNLRKAIADAALSYNKFQRGEVIEDLPSPVKKATGFVGKLFNRGVKPGTQSQG